MKLQDLLDAISDSKGYLELDLTLRSPALTDHDIKNICKIITENSEEFDDVDVINLANNNIKTLPTNFYKLTDLECVHEINLQKNPLLFSGLKIAANVHRVDLE